MKVIKPTRLLAKAAEVLVEDLDDFVVVDTAILEVALAGDSLLAVPATRDLDAR